MAAIYAISDIHGCYAAMIETLKLVDLDSSEENKLIFLGDYIDRGEDSRKVLYYIKKLEDRHPKQVIVLLGNHEEMFLDFCNNLVDSLKLKWISVDEYFITIRSFFTDEQFVRIESNPYHLKLFDMVEFIAQEIKKNHHELLEWLLEKEKEPRFFETENQIYVHAGISEEYGELWKYSTDPNDFTWKYPAETGIFYKDIIAGHVSSAKVANDESYLGRIFCDNFNHFFIDGETIRSKKIPLLKYNTDSSVYSSYEKQNNGLWTEYKIIKR